MSLKNKSEIRSHYKTVRQNIPLDTKSEMDGRIAELFFGLSEYRECSALLAFVSKSTEVDTERIIRQAFSDGKTVAVPRCDVKTNTMRFFEIRSFLDLETGCYGISEPKKNYPELRSFDDSVCIVPGLVYDKERFRVGFGGGYYDRFLSEYSGVSVGVCYSSCIERILPKDEFDRPVDILITDTTIFRKDNGYGL
ncbi:MAG: 5-formyltetrahydrofolate cyclo-ligase [Ruminococcus sp.]|nr:5-formyltetrahydrofolate cyclo-ligase [Ruminococcus sp.]